MISYKLFVNNVDYSSFLVYPATFTFKNLTDSFNTFEFTLSYMTQDLPLKPQRRVDIEVYEDGSLVDEFNGILINDSVERIGVRNLYRHKLSVMEYTFFLQNRILPDITITRVEGIYEPTLKDTVEKILFAADIDISLAPETASILDSELSTEWTFTRYSVLEALRFVFAVVQITPYMKFSDVLEHITIVDSEEEIEFTGYESSYNPETFKTAIRSNIENFLLAEGERFIKEPQYGWITPRSQNNATISADEAFIPTSRPIDRVNNLWIRFKVKYLVNYSYEVPSASGGTNTQFGSELVEVDLHDLNLDWFDFKLDDLVVEDVVYETLENTDDITYDAASDRLIAGKGASLFYVQGRPGIFGLSDRAPSRWELFVSNRQSIGEIYEWYIEQPNTAPYTSYPNLFVKPVLKEDKINQLLQDLNSRITIEEEEYTVTSLFINLEKTTDSLNDIPDFEFRVEYAPYIKTNITTYNADAGEDKNEEILTEQFYNYQGTVVSNQLLSELHRKVSDTSRSYSIIKTQIAKKYSDLIPIGTRIGKGVISQAFQVINSNNIITDYTIDEKFAKLNTYVAVLEEYRSTSIPNENIVERQFDRNVFATFDTEINQSNVLGTLQAEDYINFSPVRAIELMPEENEDLRQILPATFFAFNTQVRMEIEFTTNARTGSKSNPSATEDQRVDAPVLYVDENGFLEKLDVKLVEGFVEQGNPWTLQDSHNLPLTNKIMPTVFFNGVEEIQKDSREKLRYSFSIHHLDDTGRGFVTPRWPKALGFTNAAYGLNNSPNLKFVYLDIPLRNDRIIDTDNVLGERTTIGEFGTQSGSVLLPVFSNTTNTLAKSWAITDENYNVLYWYDEEVNLLESNTQIYINFNSFWTSFEKPLNLPIIETTITYYTEPILTEILDNPIVDSTIPYWTEEILFDLLDDPIVEQSVTYLTEPVIFERLDNPIVDSSVNYFTEPNIFEYLDNPIIEKTINYYTDPVIVNILDTPILEQSIYYYTDPVNYNILAAPVVDQAITYYTEPNIYTTLVSPVITQTIGYLTDPRIVVNLDNPVVEQTSAYLTTPIIYDILEAPVIDQTSVYLTNSTTFTELNEPVIDQTVNYYTNENVFIDYIVAFKDFDGENIDTQIVWQGENAIAPPNPTRVGYTFTGWDTNFTNVQSNLIITATYSLVTYTITYDLNNGINNANNPNSYTVNDTPITLQDPTRNGFLFLGWTPEGIIEEGETGNKSFEALWISNITEKPTTELLQPGLDVVSFRITNNDSDPVDVDWEIVRISNSVVVNSGTLQLDADPDNAIVSATGLDSGTQYKLTNVFATASGKQTSAEADEQFATTAVSYTFDSNGGTPEYDGNTVNTGFPVSNPGSPTRTAYTFDGWTVGGTIVSFPYNIQEDTTFVAKWTPIEYNITYVLNGGANSPSNPSTYNIEDTPITLANPTRSGYCFNGWSPTNTISTGSTGDKTFTASWTSREQLDTPDYIGHVDEWNQVKITLSNNDSVVANLRAILINTQTGESVFNTEFGAAPGVQYTINVPAEPETTYWINWQAVVATGCYSNSVVGGGQNVITSTPAQPQTATPSTASSQKTQTTVSFTITNNDSLSGSAEWEIRKDTSTGPIVASSGGQSIGPSGNSSTKTITVEATGLDPDTLYYLNNVYVTVSGKTKSNKGSIRINTTDPIPQTSTPTTATGSKTETSVSFTLKNNDNTAGVAEWEIREGSTSGTIVASNSNVSIGASGAANDTITASATGLDPSTTYWFTQTYVTANGKLKSNMGTSRSLTTDTPPPTFDIRAKLESTTFAITSVDHTLEGSPSSTSLNTSNFTTLYTNVDQNDSFTITAPSSFSYNGTTFTFTNWEVNGDGQGSNTTYTTNVSEDIDAIAIYGAFGGF